MKKIPINEIKAESAKKAIKMAHEKFGKTISVNGCNGSSDLGQLTSVAANMVRDNVPNAFVRCPYALYPEVEGPGNVLLYDDYQIVIDGCRERCVAKTLKKAGVKVDLSYAMDEDFGLVKHPQPTKFKEEDLQNVVNKIVDDVKELKAKEKFFETEAN